MFSLTLGPIEKEAKVKKADPVKKPNPAGEDAQISDDDKSQEQNLEELMKGLKEDDEMQFNIETVNNDQDNDQFIRMINTDDAIKM